MTEFNQRERFILQRALDVKIRKLDDSAEKDLYRKFRKKVVKWVCEIEGNITTNEGVGE